MSVKLQINKGNHILKQVLFNLDTALFKNVNAAMYTVFRYHKRNQQSFACLILTENEKKSWEKFYY